MTRENEIRKLLKISVQKSNDRDFELTDDEVINLPFKGSYEYGFVSGALWRKRQMVKRVREWLETNQQHFVLTEKDINDLIKAMEE